MRILILLCAVPGVWCYSSGLVSGSCADMTPGHPGSPQNTESPFTVSAAQTTFTPGESVTVSLQAPASTPFMGFLLEARAPGGQSAVGSFAVNSASARLLTCFQTPNAAVSHVSSSAKTNIQVTWKAAGNIEAVQFQASFVQSYKTFWVGVKSPVLSLSSMTGSSSTSNISSAGCGSSKVCISQPADCDPAGGSQCRFMSAMLLSPGGPAVRYEVTGAADGYIAFGFSDDQKMGNDDIYICGLDSKGSVGVTHAFSTGETSPKVQPLGNVSDVQASVQNGVLSCSFTSSNPISTQRSSNLSSLYYLLFAYGASSNGMIQMHKDTFTSSQRVDISAPAVVQSDGKVDIIRAHGALMLIAWMTTGPLGMIVARFLKSMGTGVKPCGKDLWFVVHVSVMTVTVAATIIAFILAFSFVNGWAEGAHPVLGVLVMILALIQPILALMRCGPQHPWRFLFNWAHFFIAASVQLLAVAAIFTGVQMMDSTPNGWLVKVMGGFAGWQALFYGLLELRARWKSSGAEPSRTAASNMVGAAGLLLLLYILGNLSFLVALLVGISQMSYT
ncbi:putative ferric-chelate reductase 1 [Fundulus diaphanus]